MIIQGVTLNNVGFVQDQQPFVTSGALLYLDAGNTLSYPGTGTTWTDLSTNTNDATIVGSPIFTSSVTASYFTFPNDTNKYATTPYTKYSGTYTGKTTFFVVRMDAGVADGYHAMFGTAGGNRTFNTYIYKSGSNYQIHGSFGSGASLSNVLALTTNQWFTCGITQDASGNMTSYFNGSAAGVATGQTLGTTYNGTDAQLVSKSDNFWHGDIAVAFVYGRALSSAEMSQNHAAVRTRYGI